jgi:deoxyribodipyrimidine photolyase-related protein
MNLIILPNQLFPIESIKKYKLNEIYLLEEPRYFTDFLFHKLKLVYHRASMKKYYDLLLSKYKNIKIHYIEFTSINDSFYSSLNSDKTLYYDPVDHKLFNKYSKLLNKAEILDNLNFLLTTKEINENKSIFYNSKTKKYNHESFYIFQRKRLNILIKKGEADDDKPIGNKWSYDTENRQNLPKNIKIPEISNIPKDKYYLEAVSYISKHFKDNYGDIDNWIYPIDTKGALDFLNKFIKERLDNFGLYEDAVKSDKPFLFHSVLSPMMNIGIVTDKIIIEVVNTYYNQNKDKIPIASFEGFIRQIIGWRNYVYTIYILEPNMYNENFLGHKKKLESEKYWLAKTEIKPIDDIIKKIVKYSYCHHIERLMFLGNWLLLNEIDPKEVHRIFMEWTIDAYDWVMVPNVIGMSQYGDGGNMMKRVYFSSSNYIFKMSDYKKSKNETWWSIWDALYYRFIYKNINLLKANYATSRQVKHWENKSQEEKKKLLQIADDY